MKISPKALYKLYGETLRNPKYRWWVILGSIAYFISPFDLSPDVFPIIGQVDDFLILTLMFNELFQLALNYFKPPNDNINDNVQKDNENNSKNAKTIDVDAVSID